MASDNQSSKTNQLFILLGLLVANIIATIILLIAAINIPHQPSVIGRYKHYSQTKYYASGKKDTEINYYERNNIDFTIEFNEDGTGEILLVAYSSGEPHKEYQRWIIPFTWDETEVTMDMSGVYYGQDPTHTETYSLTEDGKMVCLLYKGAHTSEYTSTDTEECFERIEE